MPGPDSFQPGRSAHATGVSRICGVRNGDRLMRRPPRKCGGNTEDKKQKKKAPHAPLRMRLAARGGLPASSWDRWRVHCARTTTHRSPRAPILDRLPPPRHWRRRVAEINCVENATVTSAILPLSSASVILLSLKPNEGEGHLLLFLVARAHDAIERGIDFVAQQRPQRGTVIGGKGGDDYLIGVARAVQKMLRIETAVRLLDVEQSARDRIGGRVGGAARARAAPQHCRPARGPCRLAG